MKKTTEYFNMSMDELLKENADGYTREEAKLFDEGLHIAFCDNEKEYQEELEYIKTKTKYYVKDVVLTINERIAIILM